MATTPRESVTWGEEESMEAPPTPVGGRTNIGGSGAHTNNKGTERVPPHLTFGDTLPSNMDAPTDYKMRTAIMHNRGIRGVEANTNPGNGTELRPERQEFGGPVTQSMDNDEQTGFDGDDNDVAADIARRRPGRGGSYYAE